jgi:hypothetical protein
MGFEYKMTMSEEYYEHRKTRQKEMVLRHKTTYHVRNASSSELSLLKVDAINELKKETKCDFVLEVNKDLLIFVELKDSNIRKATRQIKSTIQGLLHEKDKRKLRIDARIVPTNVHRTDIASNEFKLFRDFIKDLRGDLKYQSTLLQETI